MTRLGSLFLVLIVVATMVTAPALGFGGPNPPEKAIENCFTNIVKQAAKGKGPGDGNKGAKDPALVLPFDPSVTNCDHFWQAVGAIGNTP